MATRSSNIGRVFELGYPPLYNDIPCVASDIVYEGSAVGLSSGYARPLVAADEFCGFAISKVDNSSGSAGDKTVRVIQQGIVKADVVGASAVTHINDDVYMSDDDVFTLTSNSNTKVGKVVRWISGTTCMVAFQAAAIQSI